MHVHTCHVQMHTPFAHAHLYLLYIDYIYIMCPPMDPGLVRLTCIFSSVVCLLKKRVQLVYTAGDFICCMSGAACAEPTLPVVAGMLIEASLENPSSELTQADKKQTRCYRK